MVPVETTAGLPNGLLAANWCQSHVPPTDESPAFVLVALKTNPHSHCWAGPGGFNKGKSIFAQWNIWFVQREDPCVSPVRASILVREAK